MDSKIYQIDNLRVNNNINQRKTNPRKPILFHNYKTRLNKKKRNYRSKKYQKSNQNSS